MTTTPAPLLAYNRINANRRNTRLLIAAFALLVVPFAYVAARQLPLDVRAPVWILPACSVALAVSFVAVVAFLGSLFCSSLTLWRLPRGFEHEPQLQQVVENLSIAAGLPPPSLYVMECPAPNAFTVGADPDRTSLIVTRGLLELLDRRELTAVVAHELSHIGNRDSGLNMKLAALLCVIRAPLSAVTGFARCLPLVYGDGSLAAFGLGALAVISAFVLIVFFWVFFPADTLRWITHPQAPALPPVPMALLRYLFYLFAAAPAIALWLRKTVSQQREFLADADAVLLTRDPEGLALALAKVSAASGTPVHAGEATAHLFFVDPLQAGTSGRGMFPSHPPIDARVAALARMGDGVVEGLANAGEAGVDYRGRMLLNEIAPSIHLEAPDGAVADAPRYYEPGASVCLTDARTPLHSSADRRSGVIADLSDGAVLTLEGAANGFYKARTYDGTPGYIECAAGMRRSTEHDAAHFGVTHRVAASAAFTAACVPGSSFRLTEHFTPLYSMADGWSAVLQQLPAGQIVTFTGIDGYFARVRAAGVDGYIADTAGAEAFDAPEDARSSW
ncbi:MAG: M48 family metalloprotease [Vicinamibacterales bacterium]